MIKLVREYQLELSSERFTPEDGKVYFVSTEINPAADRFVEDNLEELQEIFAAEGLEFVFVRGQIGQDANGRNVPPTVLSKGQAAYHIHLEKDGLEECILNELKEVARVYSKREPIRFRIAHDDPETEGLLSEMERIARALKMKGVEPAVIDEVLAEVNRPGSLIVDQRGNLIIQDCGGALIKLNPREKALYLFLLKNPMGVSPDRLPDCKKDLLSIYRHFTIFDDEGAIENSIDSLLEDRGVLYTNISRANSKIKEILGATAGRPYQIRFSYRLGVYLIDVASKTVNWQKSF